MLPRICLTEMGFHGTAQTVQNFQPEEDENHIMLIRKLLWLDAAF